MRLTKRRSALTVNGNANTTSASLSASASTPSLHSPQVLLAPPAPPLHSASTSILAVPSLAVLSRSKSDDPSYTATSYINRHEEVEHGQDEAKQRRHHSENAEERKRDATGENRYPPNSFVLGYGWGFGRMRKARKEKIKERERGKQQEEENKVAVENELARNLVRSVVMPLSLMQWHCMRG